MYKCRYLPWEQLKPIEYELKVDGQYLCKVFKPMENE